MAGKEFPVNLSSNEADVIIAAISVFNIATENQKLSATLLNSCLTVVNKLREVAQKHQQYRQEEANKELRKASSGRYEIIGPATVRGYGKKIFDYRVGHGKK